MLSMTDISVRIAGRLLIDASSAQIVPGARVGFVGRNGVGKSTLFAAIRGDLPLESGSITLPPRWRIGSLAQEDPDGRACGQAGGRRGRRRDGREQQGRQSRHGANRTEPGTGRRRQRVTRSGDRPWRSRG